jgi:hypothetical protein
VVVGQAASLHDVTAELRITQVLCTMLAGHASSPHAHTVLSKCLPQVAPDKTPRAIAAVSRSWDDSVNFGLALAIGAGLGITTNESLTASLTQALVDAYNLVRRGCPTACSKKFRASQMACVEAPMIGPDLLCPIMAWYAGCHQCGLDPGTWPALCRGGCRCCSCLPL